MLIKLFYHIEWGVTNIFLGVVGEGIIAYIFQPFYNRSILHIAAFPKMCIRDSVMITGESGTGKDVVANLIHKSSRRSDKPFIKINCAAIPEALLESEFFGYEKGAFTGANENGKIGLFEMADGGTLFLDEIGELSLPMQSKLLRVIQEKEIRRIGGEKTAVSYTHLDVYKRQP